MLTPTKFLIIALLVLAGGGLRAIAQSADMERKLDVPLSLSVETAPLPVALGKISNYSEIQIRVESQAFDLLPYGDQTELSVQLNEVSLREGLRTVLHQMGLEYRINEDHLLVIPSKALHRIGGRANWNQMKLLAWLYQHGPGTQAVAKRIEELCQQARFEHPADMGGVQNPINTLYRGLVDSREPNWVAALDQVLKPVNCTWYPEDERLVILTSDGQTMRKVDRVVSIRYSNQSIRSVLLDLMRQGDLRATFEPGCLKALPADIQTNFSLLLRDASIRQALDAISGSTGLGYLIRSDGTVHFSYADTSLPADGNQSSYKRNPPVAKIVVPSGDGTEIVFFIRANDLPPHLHEAYEQKRVQVVKRLEKMLTDEQNSE